MKYYVPFAAGAILVLAVACGGDSESNGEDSSSQGRSFEDIGVGADSVGVAAYTGWEMTQNVSGAQANSTLPGVTVVGAGEVKAEPDRVRVRLTVGSGEDYFDSGLPSLEIVKEEDLEPVVKALKDEGVSEEDISVNTFAQNEYSYFGAGAAQITFLWPRPDELETILETAQEAIRRKTDYSLQNLEVMFTLSECEPLEEKAEEAALEDARRKAKRLAGMADLSLGDIIAISEASGLLGLSIGLSGCDAYDEFASFDYYPAEGFSSPSEVTVSVTLQISFAIQ